jgi:hypothetical protein
MLFTTRPLNRTRIYSGTVAGKPYRYRWYGYFLPSPADMLILLDCFGRE